MTASTAIVGGRLIDGTGTASIDDGLVLVEGDRIAYAGPRGGGQVPAGARTIDASGATIMPGMMDVHVHISLCAPTDLVAELTSRSVGEIAFDVANNLTQTVAAGVTTIRTVSDLAHLDIAAGKAISQGKIVGPRVHACGMGLTSTGGHGEVMPCWLTQSHGHISEVVDGPNAVRAAVRRQARAGATWIKIFQTGGVIDPHGRLDAEEFAPDEFETAMQTATMMAMPVAVHAHNKPAILRCIEHGVRSVEHGMHFDEECAAAAAGSQTYFVPTLTVMDRILKYGAQAGLADYMVDNVRERTTQHHDYVRHAYEVGVNIACGTDAGSLLTPHGSAGREVVQLVQCGLSPVQAIQIATQNTARMLGVDDEVGTLEEGRLADVIVVEGDVEGRVENLELAGNMRHVLVGGRPVASGGRALVH